MAKQAFLAASGRLQRHAVIDFDGLLLAATLLLTKREFQRLLYQETANSGHLRNCDEAGISLS